MKSTRSLNPSITWIVLTLLLAMMLSACNAPAGPSTEATVPATSASNPSAPASTTPAGDTKTPINIAALKGPTAMGLVKLMEENENGAAANDYSFSLVGAADEVSAGLINGSLDIAAVPANLAAVLYNRTEGGVNVLAINTLGALYVLEAGESIESVADLQGKTLYSTGKGTTPEYSLNYILAQNGFAEGDITIEYTSEAAEIAAMLEQGTAKIAVLPEPMVTTVLTKNSNLRVALSLAEEWDKVKGSGGSLVAGTYVVRTAFLEENKEAVDAFLAEARASIAFTGENLEEAAELVAKNGIVPSVEMAKQALPNCNIVYREGEELEADLSGYFGVLFEANPQSVGGKLPDAEFYYKK